MSKNASKKKKKNFDHRDFTAHKYINFIYIDIAIMTMLYCVELSSVLYLHYGYSIFFVLFNRICGAFFFLVSTGNFESVLVWCVGQSGFSPVLNCVYFNHKRRINNVVKNKPNSTERIFYAVEYSHTCEFLTMKNKKKIELRTVERIKKNEKKLETTGNTLNTETIKAHGIQSSSTTTVWIECQRLRFNFNVDREYTAHTVRTIVCTCVCVRAYVFRFQQFGTMR